MILFCVSGLFAQAPKLELTVIEKKMNMTQIEKMGKAKISYKPGDIIKYTVLAQNTGKGEMTQPVITDPIPLGVAYKPHSAKGQQAVIKYSIDGGEKFQSWPPKYKIKDKNGQSVRKVASPDMITHIRWELKKSLASNESKELEFEVIVK